MTDIVTYQPPFGIIGAIANYIIIRNRLQQIFDYRSVAMEKRFGKYQQFSY
jgi:ligand-binding SRPBCC domain-containing protein